MLFIPQTFLCICIHHTAKILTLIWVKSIRICFVRSYILLSKTVSAVLWVVLKTDCYKYQIYTDFKGIVFLLIHIEWPLDQLVQHWVCINPQMTYLLISYALFKRHNYFSVIMKLEPCMPQKNLLYSVIRLRSNLVKILEELLTLGHHIL